MTVAADLGRGACRQLADFGHGLGWSQLPAQTALQLRHHLLDALGVALAATALQTTHRAAALVEEQARGVTAIGSPRGLAAADAAFINGVLIHSLDFDDTHLESIVHPGATVVASALAAGSQAGRSLREVLVAMAFGYEVCIRLAIAGCDPNRHASIFFERGLHATSICGTVAAAATAGKLLGLSPQALAHALAISTSFASGILESNRTGGTVKRLHCGWAARSGLLAARAALAGIEGSPYALEGGFGLLHAMCGQPGRVTESCDDLGRRWHTDDVALKPYPCNHFTHGAIDAALSLRSRVSLAEIEEIEVGLAAPALRSVAEPRDEKLAPASGYGAKFSAPYVVAAALVGGGGLGLAEADFSDEARSRPALRRLMGRIECRADDECSRAFPQSFAASLRIRTAATIHAARVRHSQGSRERPLTSQQVVQKFEHNARAELPRPQLERLLELALAGADVGCSELLLATCGRCQGADLARRGEV